MKINRRFKVDSVAVAHPTEPEYQGDLSALIVDTEDGPYAAVILPGMPIEQDFVSAWGIIMFKDISQTYFDDVVVPMTEDINKEGLEAVAKYGFKVTKKVASE